MDRHSRQTRLAEIGPSGQRRIAASTVDVPLVGLAGEVATRYLVGAGVGCVRVRDAALAIVSRSIDSAVRVEVVPRSTRSAPAFVFDECDSRGFRDPVALDVALGARGALRALRVAAENRGRDS